MMPHILGLLSALALLQLALFSSHAGARQLSKADLRAKQATAMKNFAAKAPAHGRPIKTRNITFSNPRAAGHSLVECKRHQTLTAVYHRFLR